MLGLPNIVIHRAVDKSVLEPLTRKYGVPRYCDLIFLFFRSLGPGPRPDRFSVGVSASAGWVSPYHLTDFSGDRFSQFFTAEVETSTL